MTLDGTGRLFPKLVSGILFATLCYLGITYLLGGGTALLADVSELPPELWASVLCLSLLNYGLRYVRWRYYLDSMHLKPPLLADLLAYFSGFALTTTPGKVGEAFRCVLLKPYGVSYEQSLAVCVVERVLDLLVITLLAAPLAFYHPKYAAYLGIAGLIVAGLGFMLTRSHGSGDGVKRRWGNIREFVFRFMARAGDLLSVRRLAIGNVLGLGGWLAEGLGLYLILQYLDLDIGLPLAVAIYAASMLIGALSFLPGGVGGAEAAMIGLLYAAGADLTTATSATIVCRLATLWFAVAVGALALGAYSLRHRGYAAPGISR